MNEPVIRQHLSLAEDWFFLVFLFSLATLAYLRYFKPHKLSRLWAGAFNVRILRQSMREEPNTPRENLLLNASFSAHLALTIYLGLKAANLTLFGISGFVLYLIILLAIVAIYLVKTFVIYFIRFVANGDFSLEEYRYSLFLINRLFGVLLIPINLFLAYSEKSYGYFLIIAAAVLFSLAIFYRYFRGLFTALNSGVSLFYIFFYICTLEILPLIVGFRLLVP